RRLAVARSAILPVLCPFPTRRSSDLVGLVPNLAGDSTGTVISHRDLACLPVYRPLIGEHTLDRNAPADVQHPVAPHRQRLSPAQDRNSPLLNSSHVDNPHAVYCLITN